MITQAFWNNSFVCVLCGPGQIIPRELMCALVVSRRFLPIAMGGMRIKKINSTIMVELMSQDLQKSGPSGPCLLLCTHSVNSPWQCRVKCVQEEVGLF